MKYIIDTEFIDTPSCSALISLAVLREDGRGLYFEYDYPKNEITPWLAENVVPHLRGDAVSSFKGSAIAIDDFITGDPRPEFWGYYSAYDWYWFCRLWGGFMEMPKGWPMLCREFAYVQQGVPDVAGAEHNAMNDCYSILAAMKLKNLV